MMVFLPLVWYLQFLHTTIVGMKCSLEKRYQQKQRLQRPKAEHEQYFDQGRQREY